MAAVSIEPSDLAPFAEIDQAKAAAMIADVTARAARVAPCILEDELDDQHAAAAKAILRDAILRRNQVGAGAASMEVAGPYTQQVDTRPASRVLLWPTEISELQAICREHSGESQAGAFTVDMAPAGGALHAPFCDLHFGGDHCSCGVIYGTSFY